METETQKTIVTGDDFEQGLQATERCGTTGFIALVRTTNQIA